jgi:hypothetical protein
MPAEETLFRQGLEVSLSSVEHHLYHAFDVTVGWCQGSDVEPQAARNGGANLIGIEDLTLDLARFQDVLRQGVQNGFFTEVEAEALHPAEEAALPVADRGKLVCQPNLVPVKMGPIA